MHKAQHHDVHTDVMNATQLGERKNFSHQTHLHTQNGMHA